MKTEKAFTLAEKVVLVSGAKRGAIYDLRNGTVYSVDEQSKAFLLACEDARSLSEIFSSMPQLSTNRCMAYLDKLIANDLGRYCDTGEVLERNTPAILPAKLEFVWLEVTSGCNLRCVHFYEEGCPSLIGSDSDILLAKNYLLEMSARLQTIPNAIFLSFKENVEMGQPVTNDASILSGLPIPNTKKDKRIARQLKKNQINHHKIDYDIGVELLNDTNYFRDLGFGRIMGGFDLPAMVVGHNMCLRKEIVKEAGGFSNHFKGWGLEDTYFGARVIAAGNFVIPVLSTGVYHINHSPRSGTEEQQKREYSQNIKKYIELMREPLV
jgi:hypothetical protein